MLVALSLAPLLQADDNIVMYLNSFSVLDPIMIFLSLFDLMVWGILGLILSRRDRKLFVVLALLVITVFILETALKQAFQRPRPLDVLAVRDVLFAGGYSMPSGHAMRNFACARFLSGKVSRPVVLWVYACLVALSRVFLAAHYLSDVIMGAALGYSMGIMWVKYEPFFRKHLGRVGL